MKSKSVRFHRKFALLPAVLNLEFLRACSFVNIEPPKVVVRRDPKLVRMGLTKF